MSEWWRTMGPEPDPTNPALGMHIWGWMAPAELEWLGAQAATMASVVEVGSLRGRSAFMLLSRCPGPVYCIDPWDDPGNHGFVGFLENCGHFENLRCIHGHSPGVSEKILRMNDAPVDMVFIDGDHSYESCKADIEGWLPHTTKLICGHDYANEDGGFPGVAQAVREIFGSEFTVADETAIWAVRL